jgi:hypothetical protein
MCVAASLANFRGIPRRRRRDIFGPAAGPRGAHLVTLRPDIDPVIRAFSALGGLGHSPPSSWT